MLAGLLALPAVASAATKPATISKLTPSSGAVGTAVSISGTNFVSVKAVKFNNTSATFHVVSASSISTTVPANATTGKVTVQTAVNTATSPSPFSVLPGISSFLPTSGPAGTTVSIKGTSFTGATSVKFNGVAATYSVLSSTSISAVVPASATTGKISVSTSSGTGTSASVFTVAPHITSFSPTKGPQGTSVTITGTAFGGATSVLFNGVAATTFAVKSATQMTATVPATTSGPITVTTPGGQATSASSFLVTPAVLSFLPTSGPQGTTVTVTGTNFIGATAVTFNGTAASFSVLSATSISAVVPPGATTGTIAVTTPAGTGTSTASFTVSPFIVSFSPSSGPQGTSVTITGTTLTGATQVLFNGVAATSFVVNSATQITATVPATTSGPITVTTPGGQATSASSFIVTPVVTSFTPTQGVVGTAVTITGTTFTGATQVEFNGVSAAFTLNSATSITATVPAAATTGAITVTTPAGTAGSSTNFVVLPAITTFAPTQGQVGSSVVITGTTLGDVTSVLFNGQPASFVVNSTTQITATVPPTTSGPITVVTPSGSATTSQSFVVLPSLTLSQAVGPPTTSLTVDGYGFSPNVAIDVYFDASQVALIGTGTTGSFTGLTVTVPASATPGSHYLSAVESDNGRFAQIGFLVQTDWSQFRFGPDHDGDNSYENVVSAANVDDLNENWSAATGGSLTSPVDVGGTLYVGAGDGKVYAIDDQTGAILWTAATGGAISGSVAVANGIVYVGSTDFKVYAFSAATGAPAWSTPTTTGAAVVSSPAVANGSVYIGSNDDKLYSLNAATGAINWTYTTGGSVESSPAVANGLVIFGSNDHRVYALNATTGALVWSYTTGGAVQSSPAVANGSVYIGSNDDNVYALNEENGQEEWAFGTGGAVVSSPAVANGMIFVGSDDGNLYALDEFGNNPWTMGTGGPVESSPVVADGVVYVGSDDGGVYAIDTNGNGQTGNPLWMAMTGGPITSEPILVNGQLFVGSSDRSLYNYDL